MAPLPPPLPPADYPVLLRRSTSWLPEELGVSAAVRREARRLARQVAASQAAGRRDAVARHLLALAACRVGWMWSVARIPLFQAPGLLLADPRREAFYWSLDPGLPVGFERDAVNRLAMLLREMEQPAEPDAGPERVLSTEG